MVSMVSDAPPRTLRSSSGIQRTKSGFREILSLTRESHLKAKPSHFTSTKKPAKNSSRAESPCDKTFLLASLASETSFVQCRHNLLRIEIAGHRK